MVIVPGLSVGETGIEESIDGRDLRVKWLVPESVRSRVDEPQIIILNFIVWKQLFRS